MKLINQNKRVDIFYHMYCLNDYMRRFNQTMEKVRNSLLIEYVDNIYVNVLTSGNIVGRQTITYISEEQLNATLEQIRKATCGLDVCKVLDYNALDSQGHVNTGELVTLQTLYDTVKLNSKNTNILYLHSKGVSKPGNTCIDEWITYMEYFVIHKWNECLEKLQEHDTVGVYLKPSPLLHYSGNFWWATAEYILSRDRPAQKQVFQNQKPHRYSEFWLLDNPNCKPYTLHNCDQNLYEYSYTSEHYISS